MFNLGSTVPSANPLVCPKIAVGSWKTFEKISLRKKYCQLPENRCTTESESENILITPAAAST